MICLSALVNHLENNTAALHAVEHVRLRTFVAAV